MNDANTETETTETETAEPFPVGVTWEMLKARNKAAGRHFFDPSTMSGFNSRTCGTPAVGPDGAAYAVLSSQAPPTGRPGKRTEEPRRYQVIRTLPSGETERPHDPDNPTGRGFALRFDTRAAALKARDALTRGPTEHGGPDDPTAPGGSVPPDYYRWY